ncbi:MAG: Omp28-related outer membrane protein, partial [Ignavibacteriaceae bacterium]|nr:Omp28-related outer membrane protein [Ignavibacteriaceae bacterium]
MLKLRTVCLVFVFAYSITFAQVQRNPVLEYATGTWCQWCACSHQLIANEILPLMPNTIVVGYHGPPDGSDPFGNFPGDEISSLLNFFFYPSGIIDRTSSPVPIDGWIDSIQARQNIPASVDININKTYDTNTRELDLTVYVTAQQNLTQKHFINIILVEDGLRASQNGNSTCLGGSSFSHNQVVRSMLNGASGDTLFASPVNQGETITKQFTFSISNDFAAEFSRIVVFVYKENATLNRSQIAQAEEYPLVGTVVPVELTSLTGDITDNNIILRWSTASELNNHGFEIEKSADGFNFEKCGFIEGAGSSTEKRDYLY